MNEELIAELKRVAECQDLNIGSVAVIDRAIAALTAQGVPVAKIEKSEGGYYDIEDLPGTEERLPYGVHLLYLGPMDSANWAELFKLRAQHNAPQGFASWKDAAVHERLKRVKYERALSDIINQELDRLYKD